VEAVVKPPPFRYAAPATVAEAVGLLVDHAEAEPRVLAGGQSLVPLMNFRLAQPGYLVDLRRIAGLSGIRADGDALVIGAMTRQADVEDAPEVAVVAPLLAEAIGFVADRPIRNSGTIGGSLAHADPAAELPAVALALDAELVAEGPAGARRIPAAAFFCGPFTTALGADEILAEVRLPRRVGGHAFVEFARTHGTFAVVAVAAVVGVADGRIAGASIALTGVAPTPVHATAAEEALVGVDLVNVDVAAAAEAAVAELHPAGDVHASAATRTELARVHVRRALELALSRAQDGR
jgi:carbon-monoxide dehydrogenase medium subunit